MGVLIPVGWLRFGDADSRTSSLKWLSNTAMSATDTKGDGAALGYKVSPSRGTTDREVGCDEYVSRARYW